MYDAFARQSARIYNVGMVGMYQFNERRKKRCESLNRIVSIFKSQMSWRFDFVVSIDIKTHDIQ